MNEIKLTSTYFLTEVISALVQEGYTLEVKRGRNEDEIIIRWASADRKTEPSNSERPNNCEHITEDGVTCARYPACDDCPDNPLNKVKGSERLVKGSDEPQQKSCATCKHALGNWDGESNNCGRCCGADRRFYEPKDEPQTERSE